MMQNLWTEYLKRFRHLDRHGISSRILRRRRRSGLRCPEALESRILLSSPAANVEAKIVLGSLYLTGNSPGLRNLVVTQDSQNPAVFDVIPGQGTTINGSSSPAQFPISQFKRDVFVTMNDGLNGSGGTHIDFVGSGFSAPGNLFVNILGNGSDSLALINAGFAGSMFVTTNDGSDSLLFDDVRVGGTTNINTGTGNDTVDITLGVFGGAFLLDGGLNGGDLLNINGSTFQKSFTANMWKSGNTINVEQGFFMTPSLQGGPSLSAQNSIGGTTFNGPASFNYLGVATRGGGGNINIGLQPPGPNDIQSFLPSQHPVTFNSLSTFVAAHVTTSVAETHFTKFAPSFIFCTRAQVEITTTTLQSWTLDQPGYNQFINTNGGVGPLVFSVSAGSLPTGLTLNANTGLLSGTPTSAATFNFTIRTQDSDGTFDTQAYAVVINAPVSITTTTLVPWTQNLAGYNQTINAIGGTGDKTFSISSGTLPDGLQLDPITGIIAGTPTAAGLGIFTVQATDSVGAFDTQAFSLTINPPVAISTTSLPDGEQGTPYSQSVVATGGTGIKTYAVVLANPLPPGLLLDSTTGLIAGVPTTLGTYTFTIEATDTLGAFDRKLLSITINSAG